MGFSRQRMHLRDDFFNTIAVEIKEARCGVQTSIYFSRPHVVQAVPVELSQIYFVGVEGGSRAHGVRVEGAGVCAEDMPLHAATRIVNKDNGKAV